MNSQMQELLYNPETTVNDLAKAIGEDKAFAERLVTLLRDYEFPPEACTVTFAIIALGFGVIRTLVAEHYSHKYVS